MTGERLNAQQRTLWSRMLVALTVLPAALDERLRTQAGLTHFQTLLLIALLHGPDGTRSMSELAESGNASPSRVSHVVARLEEDGLVERRSSAADRRTIHAALTLAGRDKIEATLPLYDAMVKDLFFDKLEAGQEDAMHDALGAIFPALCASVDERLAEQR